MSEEAEEEEKAEETKLHAKTISKVFKFLAGGGIILCAVLRWLGFLPESTVGEICLVWAVVYGLGAGTIDLNILVDKFTGVK